MLMKKPGILIIPVKIYQWMPFQSVKQGNQVLLWYPNSKTQITVTKNEVFD